jgi:hypothetical protein
MVQWFNKTIMNIRSLLITLLLSTMYLWITGCASVTPIDACIVEEPVGFWPGLWHGLISPITFIISLFKEDIAVYAINNSGGWYDFGFLLGASIIFGGGGKAAR